MPYGISDKQSDCSAWATVMKEDDGSYTTLTCHDIKQDAIDQMVAISLDEGIDPLGEVNSTNNKARSKMKKTERRTFTVRDIEARQAEDGTMRMAGYAAVFNEASLPLPFIEKIAPGAFTKTLQETPDVRLLANHEGLPMARTKNGTMRLYEDETGLYFEAELANTQEARDLYTLVERGDVDQMSFAFRVIRQNWSKDRTERTLTEVSLADGDVSIVTYPAYPATSVEAREAIKRAALALKEGREMSPETTVALSAILDKLSESYDYLEEGKDLLEVLLGLKTLQPEAELEGGEVEVELEPTDIMPESCDCCEAGCTCEDCMECGGMQEKAANVINVVDVPGQGGKIVGDHPSVLNFLPDNMPRSMSLRLAQAKRNTIK
jgi:HK97 family phage prohead protease